MEDYFDGIEVKLAENRMEVMQTQMGNVDLNFVITLALNWRHALGVFIELLLDLEEALHYFFFYFWLQLLLHVEHFEVLAAEVLERVLLLRHLFILLEESVDRLGDFHVDVCGVVDGVAHGVDHGQVGVVLLLERCLLLGVVVVRSYCLLRVLVVQCTLSRRIYWSTLCGHQMSLRSYGAQLVWHQVHRRHGARVVRILLLSAHVLVVETWCSLSILLVLTVILALAGFSLDQ